MSEELIFAPFPSDYRFKNLTDTGPYGRWNILGYAGYFQGYKNGGKASYWYCECSCAEKTVKKIPVQSLIKHVSESCGCLQRELLSKRRTSHGESKSDLYAIHNSMHARCENKNNHAYELYGDRGIYVEDAWKEYVPFRDWMLEHGWEKGLEIDRIDCDGPYGPSNCRIVTLQQNLRNKRSYRGSKSKYVGVHQDKDTGRWRAGSSDKGKTVNIGRYRTEIEAAIARDAYCDIHFPGMFHRNVPLEQVKTILESLQVPPALLEYQPLPPELPPES